MVFTASIIHAFRILLEASSIFLGPLPNLDPQRFLFWGLLGKHSRIL